MRKKLLKGALPAIETAIPPCRRWVWLHLVVALVRDHRDSWRPRARL